MNTEAQTQSPIPIKIKIRNTQIENKVVLYGQNGAGKSLIVKSVLSAILSGRSIDVGLVDVELNGPASVVAIDESGVKQFNAGIFSLNEFTFADWSGVAVVEPTAARRLYLEVYYDKYYDEDRGWVPLSYLSYGQRRQLAIEAALSAVNVVLIENFEVGLHVDAVIDLVKQIAESNAVVILETHSGLVLKAAQRYGLALYYVEPLARLRRIERLDDHEMFARELSAWNAVVVRQQ
jgi:ABC-type branched-subunit amino acid transport system ATPase component